MICSFNESWRKKYENINKSSRFIYTCKFIAIDNFFRYAMLKVFSTILYQLKKEKKSGSCRAWCLMIVFGFSTCFLYFLCHCEQRPRALQENTKKLMKERKHKCWVRNEHLDLLTLYFLPSQPLWLSNRMRFMFPFLSLLYATCENEREENIICWFYVGFASIEMPSMVSVFWWLLAGQVDEIAALFTQTFGLTSFRGELERTFLFWNFCSNEMSKICHEK